MRSTEFNETVELVILNKNDAESLELVLSELDASCVDQVYAIDGGSADHSLDVFNRFGVQVVENVSGGRGGAIKYAIKSSKADWLIFLSSDGEENPADLPNFVKAFADGNDLVIASRMADGSSGFKSDHEIKYLHRKVFLWLISRSIMILFGGKIHDCWNGYRGMNVKKAKTLTLTANDFLLEAQLTIQFLKHKYKVCEFPTIERKRYFGGSQNPALVSGWGHIALLLTEFFRKDS